MWITGLIVLALVICFITNISGFNTSALNPFKEGKIKDIVDKLLTCSLCQIWWAGLIYIVITGNIGWIPLLAVTLLSHLNSEITIFLLALQGVVAKMVNKLVDYADKE